MILANFNPGNRRRADSSQKRLAPPLSPEKFEGKKYLTAMMMRRMSKCHCVGYFVVRKVISNFTINFVKKFMKFIRPTATD